MKKAFLMSLSVLLLPVVMYAQTPRTTGGAGYIPPAPSSGFQKKVVKKVKKAFTPSTSAVTPVTTGGTGGYMPPVSSAALNDFREWCEECQQGVPHVHPNTTGGAGYVPSLPTSFYKAAEEANAAAAQEAKTQEEKTSHVFTSPWGIVYSPFEVYGYCWGIYEASIENPEAADSEQGRAVTGFCSNVIDRLSSTMNTCPNPEMVAPAKAKAKSWFHKNVVEPYLSGYESQAKGYMLQSEAMHETAEEVGAWWQKNVTDNYIAGYQSQAKSYMLQSEAMGETAREVGNWFAKQWEQFTDWLCGD